jgi:hypothetical protein
LGKLLTTFGEGEWGRQKLGGWAASAFSPQKGLGGDMLTGGDNANPLSHERPVGLRSPARPFPHPGISILAGLDTRLLNRIQTKGPGQRKGEATKNQADYRKNAESLCKPPKHHIFLDVPPL